MNKQLVSEAATSADAHFNLFRQEEIGARVKERLAQKEFNLQNAAKDGPSVTKSIGVKDADKLGSLASVKPWYCKATEPKEIKP